MLDLMKQNLTLKGKIIISVLLLIIIGGGGVVAYQFFDFTQNNPNFCVSCHLMKPAFDAWSVSVHQDINCHDCHHLSVPEMNNLMVNFIFHRPENVPDRHGKVIVPWKLCVNCHWESTEEHPDAPPINKSRIHAKHYFTEKIECSKCHGYKVHEFTPEERFCLMCHEGTEVHGTGMEALACLNCHTDKTANLRPDRDKCLFCHGGNKVREKLVEEARVDVRHFRPADEVVASAIKINVPEDAPMQFFCYECHKPHDKIRPDWGNCLDCHRHIAAVGKHGLHISTMGLGCDSCHRPHSWSVTEEQAKETCTQCHSYKSPMSYLK